MYNKIGFLTGIGGNSTGLGDYVEYCDSVAVPAVIAANDNVNGISDIINLNSTVKHKMLYRVVRDGTETYAVPRYDLPIAEAARAYYDLVEPLIHPFVKKHRDKVWIAVGNELDKNKCNWLGGWGIESAKIWNANGYKIAMYGFASGTPEIEGWKEAGMLAFLRLAGLNRDKIAVNLHEYSYDNNLLDIFPWRVGRFQFLFQVCDENQIPRPTLWFGEWGWHEDRVPSAEVGMPALIDVSNLYAQFKTIEGAALWTLQNWHSPIYNQVNTYIKPVTFHSAFYTPTNFSLQDQIFVNPDAEEEDMRVIVCDVSRHNNKKDANNKPVQPINFNTMHQKGAEGCYVRGSLGGVKIDDAFAMNWVAICNTPMKRGMYHYFNTRYTAEENFENIVSVVETYGHGDLRIALDIEPFKDNNGQYVRIDGNKVTQLVRLFKSYYRYDPVIYTAKWVMSYVDGDTSWLNSNYLWIANYVDKPPQIGEYPTMPAGTSVDQLVMHQWTSTYYDGREWGVASTGLDMDIAYNLDRILIGYAPPDYDTKPTTVVALLPQEYTDVDWGDIAPHAQRDNKRDLTASHYSAEAIYLAGDINSWIKIIDREYPSQQRAVTYFQEKGYRLEFVSFRPPKDDTLPPPPSSGAVDIHSFLLADPRAWRVVKYIDPSGNQSQEDIQDMVLGNGVFVRRKNNLGEWWTVDGKLIHDTSSAPAEIGPEAGIARVYTLYKNDIPGARKFPRYMKLGNSWTENDVHFVQFRAKNGCKNLNTNSGYAQNTCVFARHEKNVTFNTYGQNLTIDEVIWLNTGSETQIFGKHNGVPIGWIGWEAPWGRSEIVELYFDRGIMTQEPNRYCDFAT